MLIWRIDIVEIAFSHFHAFSREDKQKEELSEELYTLFRYRSFFVFSSFAAFVTKWCKDTEQNETSFKLANKSISLRFLRGRGLLIRDHFILFVSRIRRVIDSLVVTRILSSLYDELSEIYARFVSSSRV